MSWFRRRQPCHRPLVRLLPGHLPLSRGRLFEWACRGRDCSSMGQGANVSSLHDAARMHVVAHHGARS